MKTRPRVEALWLNRSSAARQPQPSFLPNEC